MAALWLVLSRTPVGAMIRAGVDNEAMAACLGVDVERLFFAVFVVGCALAGLAGIVAAPVLSVEPDMGTPILIPVLIVVVIGGLGSLRGAVAGALVVGFISDIRRRAGAAAGQHPGLRPARCRAGAAPGRALSRPSLSSHVPPDAAQDPRPRRCCSPPVPPTA